jgi:transcriptional regulator with GAF, ATPase, and Fis domain
MMDPSCAGGALTHPIGQLPGRFASAIAALGPVGLVGPLGIDEIEALIDDFLRQIGEALDVSRVALVSGANREPLKTWLRPGHPTSCDVGTPLVTSSADHLCALTVGRSDEGGGLTWPPAVVADLQLAADLLAIALQRAEQMRELASLRAESRSAGSRGADEIGDADDFEDIVGDSPALRIALGRLLEVASTDASVVILGETGTGKELFARALHNRSSRRGRPFVRVNCAALPPTLIESELFGHERGAFTGAVSMRQGRFELAHRGTIFLDEIGDLAADIQAKLLRVLQEGEFERVGSSQSRKVDVRVIAATHHDLDTAVREGRFRVDLYYRLNVFPIVLPPLRERIEDIPRLAWFFINRRQRALNRRFTRIPAAVLTALQEHAWPGNVRELENVIERAMIHSTGDTLMLDDGPGLKVWSPSRDGGTLQDVERRHIEHALRRCGWRINGSGNAAEVLGLHPNTLRFRMKKLGIQRPVAPATVHGLKRMLA